MFFDVIYEMFGILGFDFNFTGTTALDLVPYLLQYFTCAAVLFFILNMFKYWVGKILSGRFFK